MSSLNPTAKSGRQAVRVSLSLTRVSSPPTLVAGSVGRAGANAKAVVMSGLMREAGVLLLLFVVVSAAAVSAVMNAKKKEAIEL